MTQTKQSIKNKNLKSFVKKHKTEIIVITGISATAILGYLGYKYIPKLNEDSTESICKSTAPALMQSSNLNEDVGIAMKDSILKPKKPHTVKLHPRNLPNGYKASEAKKIKAEMLGITLGANQTFVEEYSRNKVA